jgi:AraC family transcriptional regulator
MALVESLQKAIDFIEEHLLDNITIEDIAKQANVSPFHFQRTFMILTDISVGEYLRRRRLTLAAQELSSTNSKIIDLAYKYGYDTPESFSKAFRKQHGVTPSDARKGNGRLQSYNRLMIQVNLKGAEPMKYKIIERDAFQVIGIKEKFSCATKETDAVIPKLWSKANNDGTIDSLAQLNNGQIKGLLGITDNDREVENVMDYWIATAYNGDVPDGFSSLEIPASKWVVFEVQGPIPEAIVSTWKQIFSEWFPSHRYEHAEIASLEVYIGAYPNPSCEIWVPIK